MNSPQNSASAKTSTVRIFGFVSLTLGCCLAALILLWLWGSPLPLWYGNVPLATLLALVLTANLIYIGWHAIAHGTIPIRPRSPVTWRDLSNVRSAAASLSTISTLAWAVILFAVFTALGTQITLGYMRWANDLARLSSGSNHPIELSTAVFGRQMGYIQNVKWLMLLIHFPLAMSLSIAGAMFFGLIRKRSIGNVAAAIGLLFAGPLVSLLASSWVIFVLWACRLLFIFYGAYYVMLLVLLLGGAVSLNFSRATLVGSSDPNLGGRAKNHWSSHFLRTILIVGLPGGIVLGFTLGILLHDMTWILTGVETTCAALYGASLVYADRSVSST